MDPLQLSNMRASLLAALDAPPIETNERLKSLLEDLVKVLDEHQRLKIDLEAEQSKCHALQIQLHDQSSSLYQALEDGALAEFKTIRNPRVEVPQLIPVNEKHHRVDEPMAYIPATFWTRYQNHRKELKGCNDYHIAGVCAKGPSCQFFHGPMEENMLLCMKAHAQRIPCPKGGACRSALCVKGHACVRATCGAGHRKGRKCFFPPKLHGIDKRIATHVPADKNATADLGDHSTDLHGVGNYVTDLHDLDTHGLAASGWAPPEAYAGDQRSSASVDIADDTSDLIDLFAPE